MSQKRRLEPALQEALPDPHAQPKRRRKYTEDDAKLAKIYENLASEVSDDRIGAAKELVSRLAPASNPSPEAVDTALTRLVRGLCSGRKAARFGFFVALTEILRQLYGPNTERSVNDLIDFAQAKTRPEAECSGQERRDHLLGLFFSYKAIAEADILWKSDAPWDSWTKYVTSVLDLAKDNRVIRDKCGLMLCEAINRLKPNEQKDRYVKYLLEQLSDSGLAKTPEGVAIWVTAASVCGNAILPTGIWRQDDPLCTKERQNLVKILKGSSVEEEDQGRQKSQSGYAMPTPSFAWDVVLSAVLEASKSDKANRKSDFEKFWLDVVDNNLFSSSSSHERKAWGFQIFAKMISTAPAWALPATFSPNLMRSLINQRKIKDRYLHQAAYAPLKEMQSRAVKDPELASTFVVQLTSNEGAIDFDHLAKTKTIETIIASADDDAMTKILSHFDNLIMHPTAQDDKEVERERRLVSDVLTTIAKSRNRDQLDPESVDQKDSWLHQFFQIFVKYAYFKPSKSAPDSTVPRPSIPEATRELFRTRLLSCLTHFASTKVDEQGRFPYVAVSSIRRLAKSKAFDLVFKGDEEVLKTVKDAHKTQERFVKAMESMDEQKKPTYRALNLLWSQTLLQVYNGDADAVSILEELSEVEQSLAEPDEGKDSGSFELLIEILLSFMSKSSALSRVLSGEVFAAFAAEMTEGALQSFIDILEKKESIKGQEELFDKDADVEEEDEGEEGEEDEVESLDMGDGSDVEMLDGSDDAGDGEGEGSEAEGGSEDDDEDEEEDEEDDAELLQFEAKLAEALGTSKANPDVSDEEASSDSDMDDEQMLALDGHLSKIFKERQGQEKSQKKERKDARETMINFKNRVLDLLAIYVKQQHASPLAFNLILPLLRLIRTTSSKQIAEKSFDLLKKYFDASKGRELPTPNSLDDTWSLLHEVHEEVAKSDAKMYGTACNRASLFLARILTGVDPKAYSRIAAIYAETQEKWYSDPKSNIQLSFFQEWLNWSNDVRKAKASSAQQQQQEVRQEQPAKKQGKQSKSKKPQEKAQQGKAKQKKNKGGKAK